MVTLSGNGCYERTAHFGVIGVVGQDAVKVVCVPGVNSFPRELFCKIFGYHLFSSPYCSQNILE